MKHQSLLKWCMALLMAVVSFTSADAANKIGSTDVNGIKYNLYDDATAVVYGYTDAVTAKIIIPKNIVYNNDVFTVTSIGEAAFSGCSALESVEMNSVTSIGRYAFDGCTSLQSVEMNSVTSIDDYAFHGCTSLQSVEMNSVTSIDDYAFNGFSSLQSVEMNSVTSIGESAFRNCSSLESVEMNSVTKIGKRAFADCYSLRNITLLNPTPPSIAEYGFGFEGSFCKSNGDFSVIIPFKSKAKYLEEWGASFKFHCLDTEGETMIVETDNTAGRLMNNISINDLPNIWSLTLSGEINGSDLNVINRMENLERLDLSNCRVVAGGAVYYKGSDKEYSTQDDILGDYSIRLVTLDSIAYPQVAEIKESAVSMPPYILSYAVVPASVTTLYPTATCRNYVFSYGDNNLLTSKGTSSIKGATKVELGRSVSNASFFQKVSSTLEEVTIMYPYTELYDSFFSECSKLSSITLPTSVQKIGSKTFYNCSSLLSINIPANVQQIDAETFYGCSSLPSIKIPANVQQIGSQTFYGCTGLKEVICCAQTPPSARANSFSNSTYKAATLYVPVGTYAAYFFDPVWGMFANIVESEELTNGVGDVMVEDVDGPVSIYDLQGIQRYHGERDAMPTLPRGVYIIRTANGKAEKVML